MNIIGISAFYHDSAACLIQDGKLVAAASEERFSRVKYDPRLPVQAFRYCLRAGGIGVDQIDCIAYYESPVKKLGRQLWSGISQSGADELAWLDPMQPERAIRERLGFEGPIHYYEHHQSHAAGAFFFSGFEDAAILTVDGVGEWATTTYGRGHGSGLTLFESVDFPHSLGLLYATITSFLGFKVNDGEYKVMGLAPYGEPRYVDQMKRLIQSGSAGQYRLDMKYFDFVNGTRMFTPALSDLLGIQPRGKDSGMKDVHKDIAKSLQVVLEEILLEKVGYLAEQVDSPNLCMSGGVALNCVANGRILREGPFKRLFVQPAAGDAGSCLGAAALAHIALTGERHSREPMKHVYLGPSWNGGEVAALVQATGLPAIDMRDRETALIDAVVDRLIARRVVGWFHGAMEFGPRALGARSILANPLDPEIRGRLNHMVKKRESFRPFAPSVLRPHVHEHFEMDHDSPFMLEICKVTSPLDLPGITHVDQSARPQTVDAAVSPRYAALIEAFRQRSGCPMLVNTSFNIKGEPIVCSPVDALFCLGHSGIDTLVLEDFIIDRSMLPDGWEDLLAAWSHRAKGGFARRKSAISENLYTFV